MEEEQHGEEEVEEKKTFSFPWPWELVPRPFFLADREPDHECSGLTKKQKNALQRAAKAAAKAELHH